LASFVADLSGLPVVVMIAGLSSTIPWQWVWPGCFRVDLNHVADLWHGILFVAVLAMKTG
jgi:hypothetical protein